MRSWINKIFPLLLCIFCCPVIADAHKLQINQFGYIGQLWMYHAHLLILGGYRHYDPHEAIFLKQDSYSPFISNRVMNGFNYSSGDPVMQIDPSGHEAQNFRQIFAELLGEDEDFVFPLTEDIHAGPGLMLFNIADNAPPEDFFALPPPAIPVVAPAEIGEPELRLSESYLQQLNELEGNNYAAPIHRVANQYANLVSQNMDVFNGDNIDGYSVYSVMQERFLPLLNDPEVNPRSKILAMKKITSIIDDPTAEASSYGHVLGYARGLGSQPEVSIEHMVNLYRFGIRADYYDALRQVARERAFMPLG